MYLNVVFLPFLSALISGLFGKNLGFKGSGIITTFSISLTFFISLLIFYEVGLNESPCYIHLFNWVDLEFFSISWGFLFDSLTAIMLIVVTFISTLVHFYSTEYMLNDPHLPRFMCYLSLFTFFMLMLVTADNFIQMFVGWEGVGVCSYLLINFWFTRIQANKSAIKAMLVNRVGDIGLSLGIFTIYYVFNSVNYSVVFSLVTNFISHKLIFFEWEIFSITFIGIFLFIGAIGKSAQLGLHVWLPDAMEGPTPVSALIHAATMVTAGIFLLARCSPIFEYTQVSLIIISIFGACTCFFAASIGLVQNDLKKVIAYSTCSQLGYMVFACGLSNYSVSIFHLANHAFFKALLFLGAGSVIHSVSDEQDMRKMGGLKQLIPFTYIIMLIGSLSLMGFPFLTGFYSKDVILEVAYSKFSLHSHFAYWLGSFGAFFTAYYSIRLLYLTFLSECNAYKPSLKKVHESATPMILPLFFLVFPSIFLGYFSKDMIIGFGTNFWGNSLFISPNNLTLTDSEFISIFNKLLPVFLSILGGFFSYLFYSYGFDMIYFFKIGLLGRLIYKFLNKKWFFDKVYNEHFNQLFLEFCYKISYKSIDRGVIEIFGPHGLSDFISSISLELKQIQSGIIYNYMFLIVGFILFFLILFTFTYRTGQAVYMSGFALPGYSVINDLTAGLVYINYVVPGTIIFFLKIIIVILCILFLFR